MIKLRNLTVGYTGPVLRDVNLDICPGEVLALVGPNGSGKSTLMRTILGLIPPQNGEVLLEDVPLSHLSGRERGRKMSYLGQSPGTPSITVERLVLHGRFPHLGYPRRYGKRDYEIVRRAMERCGVAELAGRPMEQLSGGQRQRAYLAMVLAQDTPYLFFDEPTTYLDVAHQLEVMALARSLAAEGKGVVLVLHDLTLALRGADRLAVVDGGCLCALGTPEEVYNSEVLPRVFGAEIERVALGEGWRYFYK